MVSLTWSQHRFRLLPERAVYWVDGDALIIADPHFGKAAAFRSVGIPVPGGTTQANLQRLGSALFQCGARRMIIVGDFLHARAGRADQTMGLVDAWRQAHSPLEITLVRGNHDQHAGDPPADWNIRCVEEPWIGDGLVFCHQPCIHDAGIVVAGHIHPCVRLLDVDGSTHRAPCFLFNKRRILLPSFGSFTGSHPIRPHKGDRVFVIAHDSVDEIAVANMLSS